MWTKETITSFYSMWVIEFVVTFTGGLMDCTFQENIPTAVWRKQASPLNLSPQNSPPMPPDAPQNSTTSELLKPFKVITPRGDQQAPSCV